MRTSILKGGMALAAATLLGAAAQAQNLVVNGDFAAGNTGFTSTYPYVPFIGLTTAVGNGDYTVGPYVPHSYSDWNYLGPITPGAGVMTVNGGTDSSQAFWSETLGVKANTNYTISFYLTEISNPASNADVAVLNGATQLEDFVAPSTQDLWGFNSFTWNSGAQTSFAMSLTDLNESGVYNDFAVDNISVEATPEPGSVAVLGLGVLGILVRRRRVC